MGPKRKGRTTKTKSAAVPALTAEEQLLRDQCNLLIKDFDKEVNTLVAQSLRDVKTVSESINTLYKLELMKLPQDVKNMKWDDYWAQSLEQGTDPIAITKEVEAVMEDSVVAAVDEKLSAIKNTVRKGRKRKADTENQNTATRTTGRARRGAANRTGLNDMSNMETPIMSNKTVAATPVNTKPPPGMGKTPMITPKFGTTSLTRTITRVARTDEVLVSLSGSPVSAEISNRSKAAKVINEKNARIPLGGGETLNVPLESDMNNLNLVDLDDEQAAKLEELHRNLGNMLRMRDQASQ